MVAASSNIPKHEGPSREHCHVQGNALEWSRSGMVFVVERIPSKWAERYCRSVLLIYGSVMTPKLSLYSLQLQVLDHLSLTDKRNDADTVV